MSVHRSVRFGLLLAAAVLAGCSIHTYGVSMTPLGGTGRARQYLLSQGFTEVALQSGEQLSMERQRGDSVDHVRLFKGGPSPELPGWSSGTTAGGGIPNGARGAIPYTAGAATSGAFYAGNVPAGRGGISGKLTLEIATYRVDKDGRRQGVEPGQHLFEEADSVITLVSLVPSAQRH